MDKSDMQLILNYYTDEHGHVRLFNLERDVDKLSGKIDVADLPRYSFVTNLPQQKDPPEYLEACEGFPLQRPRSAGGASARPQSARNSQFAARPESAQQAANRNPRARPQSASAARPQSARYGQGYNFAERPLSARPTSASAASRRPATAGSSRPCSARSSLRSPWSNTFPEAHPHESVIEKMQRLLAERRLRYRDTFAVSDKFRRGSITFTHMKTAIAVLGVPLSEADYDDLFEMFRDEDGQFHYLDCCRVIEEGRAEAEVGNPERMTGTGASAARILSDLRGWPQPEETKIPTSTPGKEAAEGRPLEAVETDDECKGEGAIECEDQDEEAQLQRPQSAVSAASQPNIDAQDRENLIKRFHGKISKYVRSRGIDLASYFEGYKSVACRRHGYIGVDYIVRTLSQIGISITTEEKHMLMDLYCHEDAGGAFYYFDFCAVVDPGHMRGNTSHHLRQLVNTYAPPTALQDPRAFRRQKGYPRMHTRPERRPATKPPSKYFDRSGRVSPYSGPVPRPPSTARPSSCRSRPTSARPIGMTG
eukprot:TRINITY_DN13612_c1_g1_i1.p1 TRINITY_DN13612_c1_g1~~TRINITY_DN13612_c1_g1_i1.p1  ORF type:complete len:613 (-),score=72.26 TRINITY_DN13612_c1_g1_i1:57-1667(-)